MRRKTLTSIIVAELHACVAPLRFFERCSACVRFQDDCNDLALGVELLRRKKKIVYAQDALEDDNCIHVSAFNCAAPLAYFERTRNKCPHMGRCREEGLLLALLSGEKTLDYSHKEVTEFTTLRPRKVVRPGRLKQDIAAVANE